MLAEAMRWTCGISGFEDVLDWVQDYCHFELSEEGSCRCCDARSVACSFFFFVYMVETR